MGQRGRISLPELPNIPGRARKGYGTDDLAITTRGHHSAEPHARTLEPAGEPPDDFPGTKPEWAIYWALVQEGLEPGVEFVYGSQIGSISGVGPWSQIDFVIPHASIGIEVQGSFWHGGQGTQKQASDIHRAAQAQAQGLLLIFIDEQDCIDNPIYYVREALAGRDHSSLTQGQV